MKILITGASGLLGSKITEIALKRGYEVYAGYNRIEPTHGTPIKFDISDKNSVIKIFKKTRPEVVIHAAALTNVDECELNKELAWKINLEGTRTIVEVSKKYNAHLLYVSTDYVFDGKKGMYKETDECNPINYYGLTKLESENEVRRVMDKWCIVRPSVIYGSVPATNKVNFALWVLEKLRNGEKVKIVIDQFVSPTLNANLAQMILEIVEKELTGIYHLAGASRVSRFEMTKLIAEIFELNTSLIVPISMVDIPWKARRPRDSSLNVSKAINTLYKKPLEITDAIKALKSEINISG